jgi:hypothetical protein
MRCRGCGVTREEFVSVDTMTAGVVVIESECDDCAEIRMEEENNPEAVWVPAS